MRKNRLLLFAALAVFILLVWKAPAAREGAQWGLTLLSELLIPSLLPCFALSGLLNRLGLAEALERPCAGLMGHFSQSGAVASALLSGLLGGYPLGAAAVAQLYESGRIDREDAESALSFCDNTGPAFAVAALGSGALGSAALGLLLYAVQLVTALLVGLLFRRRTQKRAEPEQTVETKSEPDFSAALSESVKSALSSLLSVGAFVIFFAALLFVADDSGLFTLLSLPLMRLTALEPGACRALLWSFFELSGSVGLLRSLPLSAAKLAIASFALSWGGLCVHFQSTAVTAGAGLRSGKRLWGKLLQGVLAGLIAYALGLLLKL